MVIVGAPGEAFLSHIPMFGAPHDVQLIVAGTVSMDPASSGSALPGSFSDALHTFLPDKTSLDALRVGSTRELRGQIFVGNFEAGGRPLPSRVRFVVSRVVHQRVLDAGATEPELTYVLFGTHERTFAVHRIAAPPSFDEVLRVDLDASAPPDAELAAGVEATIQGARDVATSRLGLAVAPRQARSGNRAVTIKTVTALSCLVGPDFASPCP